MSSQLTVSQRAQLSAELFKRQQQLDRQLAQRLDGETRAEHAHELLQQEVDERRRRVDDREVEQARSDNDLLELGAISAALRRIQGEGYGMCADCEVSIPFERLKLEPWALRCVACESRHEAAPGAARRTAR
jgi:DnaK suppressor protein